MAIQNHKSVVVYDQLSSKERHKHALAQEMGQCALFQRRTLDGLNYEAHYLSPRALQFLDALSFEQRNVRQFALGL